MVKGLVACVTFIFGCNLTRPQPVPAMSTHPLPAAPPRPPPTTQLPPNTPPTPIWRSICSTLSETVLHQRPCSLVATLWVLGTIYSGAHPLNAAIWQFECILACKDAARKLNTEGRRKVKRCWCGSYQCHLFIFLVKYIAARICTQGFRCSVLLSKSLEIVDQILQLIP